MSAREEGVKERTVESFKILLLEILQGPNSKTAEEKQIIRGRKTTRGSPLCGE